MRFRALLILPFFLACTQKQQRTEHLLDYLPQDPSIIVKINHLSNLKTELANNVFLQKIKATPLAKKVGKKLSSIEKFNPTSEAVVGFYEVGKNNFEFVLATKNLDGLSTNLNDSIPAVESFTYENQSLKKLTLEGREHYIWNVDGFHLVSSSQLLIENLIRSEFPAKAPEALQQLYEAADKTKTASFFLNLNKGKALFEPIFKGSLKIAFENFAEWMALDLSHKNNNLYLNGVSATHDSKKNFLNLFKGTTPSTESIASMAPEHTDGLVSFRFGNYNVFSQNQKKYLDVLKEPDTLLNTIEEVGILLDGDHKTVVLNSYGPSNLTDHLIKISTASDEYQGHEIRKMGSPDFLVAHLNPLLKTFQARYWTILENHFAFSEQEDTLKNLIANKNSGTTFNNSESYRSAREILPNESSLFFVSRKGGLLPLFKGFLSDEILQELEKVELDDFSITGQVTADGGVFHTQFIINKTGAKRGGHTVAPLMTVQLDSDLAITPQFVKNHRNGTYEIVVQDIDRNLYLIDAEGKILWKKQLDGIVRGKIHQVDLYQNGRLQMAFCTSNQFLVLDRNGEITKGINQTYQGGNLNGLAVFDYENNRKYRMVVTQGQKVFMYNSDGKIVDGFTYTEAASAIKHPPKHFRINNKDYLVFVHENGQLKILHRSGGDRIKVARNINFSDNEVFLYKNKFSVTDTKGILHQVDTRGKLSATNFNLGQNHGMFATAKTLALMDENILSIKGKKVELELGVYTKPTIFYIYDKIYVAVTDIQSQKIYLYDSQAEPIPNFPVYGNSVIDMIDMDGDRKLELVAKDQENSIILYGIN